MEDLRLVVDSPDTLKAARAQLSQWLKCAGVVDGAGDGLILATHEAAANAISHSHSSEPPLLRARLEEGSVTIEVTDRGRWLPLPRDHPCLGLAIIEAVPGSSIESGADGTTVRLVQPLP